MYHSRLYRLAPGLVPYLFQLCVSVIGLAGSALLEIGDEW
jgi:hypothetical protein